MPGSSLRLTSSKPNHFRTFYGGIMQTNLLSAQQNEQTESVSPQDVVKPPESTPVVKKKRSKLIVAWIGLGLFAVLFLLSFAWVGYWAYTLNTELTATQQQYSALQTEYDKLTSGHTALTLEHERVNTELSQTKTDLEKANTDLTTAQDDLDKSKGRGEKLDAQIDEAGKLAEILYVMAISDSESDILKIDRLINEVNNQELTKQWNTFANSPSEEAFGSFFEYLIFVTRESLR